MNHKLLRNSHSTRAPIEALREQAIEFGAEAARSPAAIEAARLEQARAEDLAGQDLERLRRSGQAAVDFARKVFGKKP